MAEVLPVYFSSMNTGMSRDTLRPMTWLGKYAKEAGFDGVDLAPTLDFFAGHSPTAVRRAKAAGHLTVGGLHSPVRGSGKGGKNQGGYNPTDPKAIAGKLILDTPGLSRLIMPTVEGAADLLNRYQNAVDDRLPICFFPLKDSARDNRMRTRANGKLDLLQLKDDAAGLVGVTTPEEFHDEYFGLRKYDGYVLDTTHAKNEQGSGKGVISNIDRSMPVLAPHVRAVHLSLNRADLGGDAAKESREDALNIMNGRIVGKTAMMLDALKGGAAQVDYAVVEWTIPDVVDVLQERHPHTAPTQAHINWAYGQAADTLAQYMGRDRMSTVSPV